MDGIDPYGRRVQRIRRAASPAWEFLGLPGLPKGEFPASYSTASIGPRLGYVRRGGDHGMTGYDWNWILDFSDKVFSSFVKR